jgi:hypothetical protein
LEWFKAVQRLESFNEHLVCLSPLGKPGPQQAPNRHPEWLRLLLYSFKILPDEENADSDATKVFGTLKIVQAC